MYQLRQYQADAKQAILEEWNGEHQKTLLVLPTGTGKTIVFASVIEEQVNKGHRVLILAHREELLSQASDKLRDSCGLETVLEKAEHTSLGSNVPVTVGSVQSLAQEKRLEKFSPDYFQDIIVDEAHHSLSDSYQRVLNHFPDANVLGVTATPDRGDMKNLGSYFESMAYEYLLPDAIKDAYLCPITAQMIPLEMDLTSVKTRYGDYTDESLGNALEPYLEQIADEMLISCQGRKTLVFLPLIAISQEFCSILNARGMKAAEVNGNSTDRAEILADFEAGKYDVLCNSMLLTEGWDCPSLDCIVILRPTKIRSLYVQMVGRGTRKCPGKKNLLLLDFLWLTTKHNLCRPSALIAKTEDEARRINKQVEKGDAIDILDAVETAEQEARQETLVKNLKANRGKKRATVDPVNLSAYVAPQAIDYQPTFKWEEDAPSEKQLNTLISYGVDISNVTTKGYASALIGPLQERFEKGLASAKQINYLADLGYDGDLETVTFEEAKRLIGIWKQRRRRA